MTRQTLLDAADELFKEALTLLRVRNSDYATDADPFRNLREAAERSGISTEQGIHFHVSEKLSRLGTLLEHDSDNSTVRDSILDAINYLTLLYIWRYREEYSEELPDAIYSIPDISTNATLTDTPNGDSLLSKLPSTFKTVLSKLAGR